MDQSTPPSTDLSPLKRALLALEKMQARLDRVESEKHEPIAVLGIGSRFPGGVDSPASFWKLLIEGRDAVDTFPADRVGAVSWANASPDPERNRLINQGGFLTEVEQFDAEFFGISPREAMRMDPQQRILLQTACDAIEAAGLPLEKLAGSLTGVFVGVHSQSSDYYFLQAARPEAMDTYTSTGSAHSIVANRLSYLLDLRGPSLVVDTACSSSLVALHLACQSLRARESHVALAGGVNLMLTPETSLAFSKLEFLSVDGRCKTFDASADGFVRAEGCGVIVLKRLSDALRDRDPILAVVRGTAVNQDGATNGLTAPNSLSQVAVIRAALEDGRVDPDRITLIESHGTGTALGDPIEVDALRSVYSGNVRRALGSVKTNIGHAEAAAGIAGVIKCVLALSRRIIPPNLHFRSLNPHINLADSQFFIPTQPVPWDPVEGGRFASVSSFGFGGTNSHAILQEAPATAAPQAAALPQDQSLLLPISARSERALREVARHWSNLLATSAGGYSWPEMVYTASLRRSQHSNRLALVATSRAEAAARLEDVLQNRTPPGVVRGSKDLEPPRVAFVLCGQGPQWFGMGRELLESDAVFRQTIEQCAEEMKLHVAWDLLAEFMRAEDDSRLNETEIAQPALFALQLALAAVWRAWGIEPHAVIGHSMGEVGSAYLGGALSFADAVKVICHRGRIVQRATGHGRMAAIELPGSDVARLLETQNGEVSIAAVNSPTSTVVSGAPTGVEAIVAMARDRGARVKLLPVNYAFHSPQMEAFRTEMAAAVADIVALPATIPIYATVTGHLAGEDDLGADYWGKHIREPVRFAPTIQTMLRDEFNTFLEISPQPVLSAMIAQCAEAQGRKASVLPSLRARQPERARMLESLGALYVQGAAIDWPAVAPAAGRIVPLPAYPWQTKRVWLEDTTGIRTRTPAIGGAAPDSPYDLRLQSPAISGAVFEKWFQIPASGFLRDHRIFGAVIVPAPVFIEMILSGASAAFLPRVEIIQDLVLHRALVLTETNERCAQLVFEAARNGVASFTIHSRDGDASSEPVWILHASGKIVIAGDFVANAPGDSEVDSDPRWSEELSCEQFYEHFAARGADFGPTFRVVEQFRGNASEAHSELRRSGALEREAKWHGLHPVLWDAALQTIAVGCDRRDIAGDKAEGLHLFCALDELRVHASGESQVRCRARFEFEAGNCRAGYRGEARIYSPARFLLAEIKGAQFQRVEREALLASYETPAEDLIHEVLWQPCHNLRHRLRRSSRVPLPAISEITAALNGFLEEKQAASVSPKDSEVVAAFDRQCLGYIRSALCQLGWQAVMDGRFNSADFMRDLGILFQHSRLVERMLNILCEEGVLRRAGGAWEVVGEISANATLEPVGGLMARFPAYRAELELFDRCASRLGDVLHGECDPLPLLFPEGSTETATEVFGDSPMSRLPNALMRELVARVRDAVPPTGVLRILEMGAGTGGTTAHLLSLLDDIPCEYLLSNLSQSFLKKARERFAAHPFLRFALLDIEQPPETQGFATGQFDLIIAANVVHATRDLRQAMANVRTLLAPGGLVALIEGTRPARWIDLVFGQTEGWWRFADVDLRPSHPLLPAEVWSSVLRDAGFSESAHVPARLRDESSLFDQALILGKSPDQEAPAASSELGHGSEAEAWVILGNHGSLGQPLVEQLRVRGHSAAVVDQAQGTATLETVLTQRPCRHMVLVEDVCLDPAAVEPDRFFEHALLQATRAVQAAQTLIRISQNPQPRLWFVTRTAQPVAPVTRSNPSSALLWGLGRVLAVEHPEIWGGLIDLGPEDCVTDSVQQLIAQIQDNDGEDQCAFRDGLRHVPRLVARSAPTAIGPKWNADGCYLVTGGLGGLGLHIARWLAGQGARKIVLLGRTSPPPRERWDSIEPGSRAGVQIRAVREIERTGATVQAVAVDTTDRAKLTATLEALQADGWLPVQGVVHAAAAIEDRLIPQLDEASLTTALRPKILGTLNLEICLTGQPLQFFVCCSSLGSLLGQAGQGNYAAANAFLDAYVHHRRARRLPALGINWGAWYSTGLAATPGGRRTIKSLEQRGIAGFNPAEGVAALGVLLRRSAIQATVMRLDAKRFRQSYPLGEEPPLLRALTGDVSGSTRSMPPAAGRCKESVRDQLLALDSGESRRAFLESLVGSLVTAVLKLEPETIDVQRPLGTLGLDSLMGVELKNRCEQSFGLTLSATMAWNYPTIAALSEFLAEKLGVPLVDGHGAAVGDPATAKPATTGSSVDGVLQKIEALSDEEALRSLLASSKT